MGVTEVRLGVTLGAPLGGGLSVSPGLIVGNARVIELEVGDQIAVAYAGALGSQRLAEVTFAPARHFVDCGVRIRSHDGYQPAPDRARIAALTRMLPAL